MAEDEGKVPPEGIDKGEDAAEGSNSDAAVAAGHEEGGKEEEETEGEKGGEEQQPAEEGGSQANPSEADFDSVAVTMAAALPYADAVAGVKADFTMPQLQELEQQTLIYRYMAASVPVPTHLVFPIWKSITTSSSSSVGPEQYPTLMGLATLCLDFGKTPEPEPGRCRRTDGKKWRCWRNVVPDQKYCERHLHRGRKRPVQLEIIDEPEDVPPASVSEGGTTSSKKSKKERVSKDTDTPVAVPATAAAVNSS